MYHATQVSVAANGVGVGDLEIFDRLRTRRLFGRESIDQVGSWFSNTPSSEGAGMYLPPDGAIYPVYLSISNPWIVSFVGMMRMAQRLSGQSMDARPNARSVDALRAWMAEVGLDGIRIKPDAMRDGGSEEFQRQDCWVALEPAQVKSAIGNSGIYDPQSGLLTDRPEDIAAIARHRRAMDHVGSLPRALQSRLGA
jgi:hypothetical protein